MDDFETRNNPIQFSKKNNNKKNIFSFEETAGDFKGTVIDATPNVLQLPELGQKKQILKIEEIV